MIEVQTVTLLFVAPFLVLSLFWAAGLAALKYPERKAIRVLRKTVRGDR